MKIFFKLFKSNPSFLQFQKLPTKSPFLKLIATMIQYHMSPHLTRLSFILKSTSKITTAISHLVIPAIGTLIALKPNGPVKEFRMYILDMFFDDIAFREESIAHLTANLLI